MQRVGAMSRHSVSRPLRFAKDKCLYEHLKRLAQARNSPLREQQQFFPAVETKARVDFAVHANRTGLYDRTRSFGGIFGTITVPCLNIGSDRNSYGRGDPGDNLQHFITRNFLPIWIAQSKSNYSTGGCNGAETSLFNYARTGYVPCVWEYENLRAVVKRFKVLCFLLLIGINHELHLASHTKNVEFKRNEPMIIGITGSNTPWLE